MAKILFPKKINSYPQIYVYSIEKAFPGCLKIGYTTRENVEERIEEQLINMPSRIYNIEYKCDALKDDGTYFMDYEVHRVLRKKGFENPTGEWFKCSLDDVKSAIISVKTGKEFEQVRTQNFKMRPEQEEAVNQTIAYFKNYSNENDKIPHFLWNAKMRFGKTFATYQLAKRMNWSKILIMTFKPAVEKSWEEDLNSHIDFDGWQFVSNKEENFDYTVLDENRPIVCFGSFQDFLGKSKNGGIKSKNEWVHTINWDCIVFDEYHYGAWRENAKSLFESEDEIEERLQEEKGGLEYFDEDIMPITTSSYLYLSGTPFRAISSGEFIEEQIYNWTYTDEQKAKDAYVGDNNPYAALPQMVLMTYQVPDSIKDIVSGGEFNEFDLNTFFSAEGQGKNAEFKYKDEVQKWLNLIRGNYLETSLDNLKLGAKKPPFPFSDTRLLNQLSHTFWYLPSVSSCYAMFNLLQENQNKFFDDYKIVVAAGTLAGIGIDALKPVEEAMKNPLKTKTITLSCGKLTTGVTVKPWTGIFMLRNLTSPETYFQSAFRVQSPWTIKDENQNEQILKNICYVFDFAPNRALRQIADYSCRLNIDESNPEKKVEEFINFLPVLAYDGSAMRQLDAGGILDIAMSGTTATLLARRWESALLVNVDDKTLSTLLKNEKALDALMSIEGFRSLNNDLETIINKTERIKELKKESANRDLTLKEKQELSEEEKEYKSKRKQIQEKLIKFATRIPIFMYLTDFRERTLKEVITQLEPGLFKKVTGLEVEDFELLVSIGVFNGPLMNDAVYKFKRYEDSSLEYTGLSKQQEHSIGLYDVVLSKEEYENYITDEGSEKSFFEN